jgi:hypothetical protein
MPLGPNFQAASEAAEKLTEIISDAQDFLREGKARLACGLLVPVWYEFEHYGYESVLEAAQEELGDASNGLVPSPGLRRPEWCHSAHEAFLRIRQKLFLGILSKMEEAKWSNDEVEKREEQEVKARQLFGQYAWLLAFDPGKLCKQIRRERVKVLGAKDKGIARDKRKPTGEAQANVAHSDDFRSVCWYGTDYVFTPTQAACVRVLWEAWERGSPVMGQDSILETAGSTGARLRDVFEKGKHQAWDKMIVSAKKGAFRLAELA